MPADLPPKIVLDTNVLLDALSPKLGLRGILRNLVAGRFSLFVTTEILLEYEEKLLEFYGQSVANTLLDTFLASRHVQKLEVFFRFNLLPDFDDNKFLDCAFAANAHFIVTSDKGFRALHGLAFPKIEVLSPHDFLALFEANPPTSP